MLYIYYRLESPREMVEILLVCREFAIQGGGLPVLIHPNTMHMLYIPNMPSILVQAADAMMTSRKHYQRSAVIAKSWT